jgi:DNA-binding NtrC family response regulator
MGEGTSLADEVRELRQRVAERMAELEPMVREYEQLQKVAAELGIESEQPPAPASDGAPATAPAAEPAQRPRRPRAKTPAVQREHAARLLGVVSSKPGATVAEIAAEIGVQPTSLYRLVRDLASEGALTKRGRGLYPAGAE